MITVPETKLYYVYHQLYLVYHFKYYWIKFENYSIFFRFSIKSWQNVPTYLVKLVFKFEILGFVVELNSVIYYLLIMFYGSYNNFLSYLSVFFLIPEQCKVFICLRLHKLEQFFILFLFQTWRAILVTHGLVLLYA